MVRNTTDENEMRILYQYLAEASVVFPKTFSVIHSLLGVKINTLLALCHDQVILCAVQTIIKNVLDNQETSTGQMQLHFLKTFDFGGLWRFTGPFPKTVSNLDSSELFASCLEAMLRMCPPCDDSDEKLVTDYLNSAKGSPIISEQEQPSSVPQVSTDTDESGRQSRLSPCGNYGRSLNSPNSPSHQRLSQASAHSPHSPCPHISSPQHLHVHSPPTQDLLSDPTADPMAVDTSHLRHLRKQMSVKKSGKGPKP